MSDQIIIDGIQVMAHIGVPDEERAKPQKLEISLVLHRDLSPAGRSDDLKGTIDYFFVHQRTLQIVQQKPRKLIESLAEDLSSILTKEFAMEKIEIKIRKFILENTRAVEVHITRTCTK